MHQLKIDIINANREVGANKYLVEVIKQNPLLPWRLF